MKKLICFFAVALLLIVSASAATAAVYLSADPKYEILPLAESPVTVNQEDLTFDFRQTDYYSPHSPAARVTASYQMENPSSQPIEVMMAFPMVSTFNSLQDSPISIHTDGRELPYSIRIGNPLDQQYDSDTNTSGNYQNNPEQFSEAVQIDKLLSTVSETTFHPKSFYDGSDITVNFVKAKATAGRFCIGVTIKINPKNTKILTFGSNSFTEDSSSGKITLSSWDRSGFSYVVLGDEPLSVSENAYTDASLKKEWKGDFDPEIITETEIMPLEQYLDVYASSAHQTLPKGLSREEFYAAQLKTIDSVYEGGSLVANDLSFDSFNSAKRTFLAIYSVPFAASNSCTLTVSCMIEGTMDRRGRDTPAYSYGYVTNTAKAWSAFHGVTVTILPPIRTPYIVTNSLGLTRNTDGNYTASLSGPPDRDIAFTLYRDKSLPRPELVTAEQSVDPSSIVCFFIIIGLAVYYLRHRYRT